MSVFNFTASCSGNMSFSHDNNLIPNIEVTFSQNMTFIEFPRKINDLLLFLITYNFDVRGTIAITTVAQIPIFNLSTNIGSFNSFNPDIYSKNAFIYFVLNLNNAVNISTDRGIKILSVNNLSNVQILFQINLDIYWECKAEKLESIICKEEVCSCDYLDLDNCFNCRQNFLDYCFSQPVFYSTPNIFHSDFCKTFLSNFYWNLGPDSVIEEKLVEVCSNLAGTDYESIGNFINNNRGTDALDICACHFDKNFYVRVENDAEKVFPGISNLGLLNHCFVKECVNSRYPSILIYNSGCKGAECVNILKFKDKNTNINVEIDQSNNCQSIINPFQPSNYTYYSYDHNPPYYPIPPTPPTPPTPPQPPEPPSKNRGLLLITIGGIILLLIILIAFILIRRRKMKQNINLRKTSGPKTVLKTNKVLNTRPITNPRVIKTK